jgi:TnpA family transposase
VLDQWGVLYDQPIVLNRRQAGAAIEGALRQKQVDHLEKVAVDTHGHSHFGMTLAKVVGFDLTPRLARLKTRKLHLPTGFAGAVPEVLKPLIAPTPIATCDRARMGGIAQARRFGQGRLVSGDRRPGPIWRRRAGRCRL